MGKLTYSTQQVQELLDKVAEGGTGLKYSEERTVYLTEIHEDETMSQLDISDEERAYNIETVNKTLEGLDTGKLGVFISYYGRYYFFTHGTVSDEDMQFQFGSISEGAGDLYSTKVTITNKGDAIGVTKLIQTETPRESDMNNDFNNDF